MRAPYISAENTSRPCSSVPSRYLAWPPSIQAGGSIESLSSSVARSNGLCGATMGAKSAQNTHTSATTAEPIAIGELRNECQTSPSKKRAQAPGAAGAAELIIVGACADVVVMLNARAVAAHFAFSVIHLKFM